MFTVQVETLDLSRNQIPVFSAKAFNQKQRAIVRFLPVTKRLDLSFNSIAAVEGTIDHTMQSLPTLDLRNNRLTEINPPVPSNTPLPPAPSLRSLGCLEGI